MGHYASETGIGPSEYEIKMSERLTRVRNLLAKTPANQFTADYIYDIFMVMSPRVEYNYWREKPLEKLEGYFNLEPI